MWRCGRATIDGGRGLDGGRTTAGGFRYGGRHHPRPSAVPLSGVGGHRCEPIDADTQPGVETRTRFATKEFQRRNRFLRSMRSLQISLPRSSKPSRASLRRRKRSASICGSTCRNGWPQMNTDPHRSAVSPECRRSSVKIGAPLVAKSSVGSLGCGMRFAALPAAYPPERGFRCAAVRGCDRCAHAHRYGKRVERSFRTTRRAADCPSREGRHGRGSSFSRTTLRLGAWVG